MPDKLTPPQGEIVLFQTEDGRTRVECLFADETLWLILAHDLGYISRDPLAHQAEEVARLLHRYRSAILSSDP